MKKKKYKRLSYSGRQQMEQLYTREHMELKYIAVRLGVCLSTVYRELHRGMDGNGFYCADLAQQNVGCHRK